MPLNLLQAHCKFKFKMPVTTCNSIKATFWQIKLRGFFQLAGDGKQSMREEIKNIGDARTGLKQKLLYS